MLGTTHQAPTAAPAQNGTGVTAIPTPLASLFPSLMFSKNSACTQFEKSDSPTRLMTLVPTSPSPVLLPEEMTANPSGRFPNVLCAVPLLP